MKGKVICIFLTICILLVTFTGCGDSKNTNVTPNPTDDSNEPVVNTEEPSATPKPLVAEKNVDLEGASVRYTAWFDTTPTERGESEMADLQWDRVDEMEAKYNFKWEFNTVSSSDPAEIIASILSGEPSTELFYMQPNTIWSFMSKNMLAAVDTLENINIRDYSKWSQYIVEDICTYKGHVYGFNTPVQVRGCLLFNKDYFERNNILDTYDVVRNKQWNWDKFIEVLTTMTKDTDNDGSIDEYGISIQSDRFILQAVMSNGGNFITYNENGDPVFALGEQNSLDALQFSMDVYKKYNAVLPLESGAAWDVPIAKFGEGAAAMLSSEFFAAGRIKEGDVNYGLIPFPMGPAIDDYRAASGDEIFVAIPYNVFDPEKVAAMYDIFTDPLPGYEDAETWKQYVELDLKDDESLEMYEYLYDNRQVFNNALIFPEFYNSIYWGNMWRIQQATMTPAALIDSIKDASDAILSEYVMEDHK